MCYGHTIGWSLSFCFMPRPILNLTIRLAGMWTCSKVFVNCRHTDCRVDVIQLTHLGILCIPCFPSLSIEECHNILPCKRTSAHDRKFHVTKMSPNPSTCSVKWKKCPAFLAKNSTSSEDFGGNRIYNPVVFTAVNGCSKRSPFLQIFQVFDITNVMDLQFL